MSVHKRCKVYPEKKRSSEGERKKALKHIPFAKEEKSCHDLFA